MSSDTFRFRVEKVEGRDVVMTIWPTGAGGLCDLASSRSFVLLILAQRGLPVNIDDSLDPAWLAAHLDEYVERVVPERLVGIRYEDLLRSSAATWHVPASHFVPRLTLRATLASTELTDYLPEGTAGGTTAFDVWLDPAHTRLTLSGDNPPMYDPQPELTTRVERALRARLPGWRSDPLLGLHRPGTDARLRLYVGSGGSFLARGTLFLKLSLDVPAFEPLLAEGRSSYTRSQLIAVDVIDEASSHAVWSRRYAGSSPGPRLEFSEEDAAQESFEALADRIAAAIEPPGLDDLLHRDGLRGLFEGTLASFPVPKGRPAPTPIGAWPPSALPPGWRLEWRLHRPYIAEPIWARVTLHAAFGTREEAKEALTQVRAVSKRVPAVMKPFLASLDAE